MTVRFKIDEFTGRLGKGTPRCVLRCLARTLNGTILAIKVHEAWDINVWMSGEDCGTKFDERLFGFTAKNKVDTVAEISFCLIGCV